MARLIDPEKREKFLASALKLFVQKGVQNTSTAEIARDAGTASGTLFLYFKTKQDLIDALALRVSQEQSGAIRAQLTPSLSAREAFLVIWESALHWFMEHLDAYLYIQQIRDSGLISQAAIEESGKHLSFYFDVIGKGLAEGSIMPYPAELIGGILYQQVVAVMNLIHTQPDPDRQEEYIRLGFEIFWNGIRNRKEQE